MKPSIVHTHTQILFNAIFVTLTTGVFLHDYLLKIGFQPYHFGVLYALFYSMGVIAFPISFYANAIVRKKRFFTTFSAVSIGCAAVFVAAPYVPGIGREAAIWLSIAALGSSVVAEGVGKLVLFPWLHRIVGAGRWVRFFSIRQAIIYGVSISCTIGFGWLLGGKGLGVSTGLLTIALTAGVISILFIRYMPDMPQETAGAEPLNVSRVRSIMRRMLHDKSYIGILSYVVLVSVGIGLLSPIVFPYLVAEAGMTSVAISRMQLVMMATSVAGLVVLTKVSERIGNLRVLLGTSALLWLVPALLLTIPYAPLALSYLLFALGYMYAYGFVMTMAATVLLNLLMEVTPQQNKTVYLAFMECTKATCLSLGAYASGAIAERAGGYQALFVAALLCMAGAALLLRRLKTILANTVS